HSLHRIVTYGDVQFGSFLGVFNGNIPQSDRFFECRRLRTRGNPTDDIAVSIHDVVSLPWYSAVNHLEAYQLIVQPGFLLFFQSAGIDKIFRKLGDPPQSCFQWRCGIVNIISIEAKPHFQSQGVAGSQTNGLNAIWRARLEDGIPDLFRVFVSHIHLKSPRPRIARGRYEYVVYPGKITFGKRIIAHGCQVHVGEAVQYIRRLRALYRKQGGFVRNIFHGYAVSIMFGDPIPVFLNVRGVYHEEVGRFIDPVNEEVIDYPARFIRYIGVLNLAIRQLRSVVGTDFLNQVQRAVTLEDKFAHVAHV